MLPTPYYQDDSVTVRPGDCLDVLRAMPDSSVDAVVCDPPYGLSNLRPDAITAALVAWANGDRERVPDSRGFMGRAWDAFVPPPAVWDECLRVLKPGGHLVAFAGSRTYDLMGLSIRLAGFEIRDGLMWVYGSGMPKSHDVSKAIDKAAGAEREVIGKSRRHGGGIAGNGSSWEVSPSVPMLTAPASDAARKWQGWGTALKPAHEPMVLARKPFRGTVAQNVLAHGTGGLNIDAARIESTDRLVRPAISRADNAVFGAGLGASVQDEPAGRWPANVILDEHAAAALDAQSGTLRSGALDRSRITAPNGIFGAAPAALKGTYEPNEGGASRFFYCAKAPASERPKVDGQGWPTVKPLALMRWVVRLVTPPGGTVLDPFAGTGTTLQAAEQEGMHAIGIERDELALRLIAARLGPVSGEAA